MKLLHLEIENFGKLSSYQLDLRDGLNLLCEKNGWGKSTLAVFIKAMLYGLPATTKRSLDRNERKKYIPWQGGSYGGSLDFSCEKGSFRIERFFGAKEADDEFRLFDLSTNKPSTAFSANLGTELLGIDAEGFERSTYLSQRSIEGGDNDSITAKLTGLLEDVNDIGSFEGAMESIDRRRKFYELKGGRGQVNDLTQELSRCSAELEECRRALPTQQLQETKLSERREQIRLTRQEKKQAEAALQGSERRRAHLEECQRTRSRIHKAEEERTEILHAFRDQTLPTDAELSEAKAWLSDFRAEQTARLAYQLTEAEHSSEQELQGRYPNGLPQPSVLEQLQKAIGQAAEAKARLQGVQPLPKTREQQRFAATGIPQQALLDEAAEKQNRAEQLQKQLQELESTPDPKPQRRIPILVPRILCIAALLCCIVVFAMEAYRIPALILGAILTLAGALTYLLGRPKNSSPQNPKQTRMEALQQEQTACTRFVASLLERYGYAPQINPHTALTELSMLASRAREDQARMENRQRQLQALTQQYEDSRQQLRQGLAALGAASLPSDPNAALLQARTDAREWSRLCAKKRELAEKLAQSDKRSEARQDRISGFLSRLLTRESRQPEECLARMEQLCQKQADLLGQITRERSALQRFMEENHIRESDTLPDTEALHTQDATLERRLLALQEEEEAARRDLERTSAKTQRIPELEDQVRYLSAELAIAQGNLATLRRTADFLEESRQALSTRYLEGMQQHFTQYLSLTEKEDIPAARLDTSFEISVKDGGKSRDLESYSRGSRDILSFCARLSLVRSMFPEGEQPFLLLDDPFVNLDADHLRAARALLDRLSGQMQILYLVCHKGRT